MFKTIPGNFDFLVSLSGKFKATNGSECTPTFQGNQVLLNIYGIEKYVDVDWIKHIAWYEVHLPKEVGHKIFSIMFVINNAKRFKYPNGRQIMFTEPIYYKPGFRIVPNFPLYAVSKKGEVVNTQSGLSVFIKKDTDYPSLFVYNPLNSAVEFKHIHRLLALAWIGNKDPIEKPYVNHIDGNKSNYDLSNLEWCSFSENNQHAFDTGLRTDNIKVRVRDILTGEIKEYPAISKMIEDTGINAGHNEINYKTRRLNNPFKKRYEVRTENDHRPWFFDKNDELKAGRFRTTVTYEDGSTKVFNHIKDFITYHKLWNISNNMRLLSQKLIERRPGVMVEIVDHYNQKTIQARNVETDEVFEAPSFKKMAKLIGQNHSRVKIGVQYGPTRISNGWAYRFKSDQAWPTQVEDSVYIPRCISGTDECGTIHKFDSLREAERKTGITRKAIQNFCKSGKKFNGWTFKETDSTASPV